MSVHEAVAANPVTGNVNKAANRAMYTRRFAYCLTTAESATDFVAVDPDTGVIPYYLVQSNILFGYDATDTTTAHDGTTCLVTSDGKRYKSGAVDYPWSVLTQGTTAQPITPAEGDRYLLPTAATGTDWAGQDGKVGTFKSNRWQFSVVPIGRLLHIEDETSFYHRDTSGAWTAGFGSVVIGADGVNITNMLGADASFIVKVENQTTNTPPASPVAPVAYIVGPAPAGGWSAYSSGDLAICLVDGAFTRIVPATGDEVYDKALNSKYKWSGTAWTSASGSIVGFDYIETTSGSFGSFVGSGAYAYSSTPPAGEQKIFDTRTLTYTAKRAGAVLRFRWVAGKITYTTRSASLNSGDVTIGLWYDSVTSAVKFRRFCSRDYSDVPISGTNQEFITTAVDALPHTYKIGFTEGLNGSSGYDINDAQTRIFSVEEFA